MLKVLLLGLCILNLLVLFRLENTEHLLGVLLGFLHSIIGDHLFVDLTLIHLLKDILVLVLDGVLSFLATLSSFLNFLSLFLRLLDDDIDELSSLLYSNFHLDVKCSSHLFGLGVDICRSSFSCTRKSLFGCCSNSLGVLKLSQLLGSVELLLNGL